MLSWWEPSAGAKKRRKESKWRRKWADKRPGHCCDGAPPLFIFTRHQQLNLLITAKALFFLLQSTINCARALLRLFWHNEQSSIVAVSPITCDWDYSPRDPLLSTIKGKKKVAVYYYRCVKMKSYCYCEMSDFVRARPWVSACTKCAPRVWAYILRDLLSGTELYCNCCRSACTHTRRYYAISEIYKK